MPFSLSVGRHILEMQETCTFCIDGCDWLFVLTGRKTDSQKSIRGGRLMVSTAIIVSMDSSRIRQKWILAEHNSFVLDLIKELQPLVMLYILCTTLLHNFYPVNPFTP